MSASREKKNRQELNASGIPDAKKVRAEKERREQRRANWLYGSIAVIFVLVAAGLWLWNSNIIQRSSAALSVGGETYSAAEVSYYYRNAYNSVVNSQYASYFSLDTSSSLSKQVMTDTDYMFLGVTREEDAEDMTWHEYFMNSAKTSLQYVAGILKDAQANDYTFTDEMQTELDELISTVKSYAQQAGVSYSAYLKNLYGKNMTTSVFEDVQKETILASHYEQAYLDSLEYTDDEIDAYYAENKDSFDVVDYDYIQFKGTAASTTDEDGNTVEPTEEEQAAAKEAAKKAADEALERVRSGETDLEALAEEYEDIATFYSREGTTNYGDVVGEWLFEEGRQAGDSAVLENGSSYYLVLFHDRYRHDYRTVNVRHILIKVDTSSLDKEAEDYDEQLESLTGAMEAKAQQVLQEWKDAGATVEAFTELAAKYSEDPGSKDNGGLYTQVYQGRMVTEFNDWIFDESRKEGDSGIIYSASTGFHVMYFDGYDELYWKLQVKNAMSGRDYSQWAADLVKDLEIQELSGMKYVG